jgi:hypothetical protein
MQFGTSEEATDAFVIERIVLHDLWSNGNFEKKESMQGWSARSSSRGHGEIREGDTMHATRSKCLQGRLTEREALAALIDGKQQLLAKHFIRRVLG